MYREASKPQALPSKKELENGRTDYRPKGDPWRVNVHDFEDKKLGKVVPYGPAVLSTDQRIFSGFTRPATRSPSGRLGRSG